MFLSAFDEDRTKDDCADDVRINVFGLVGSGGGNLLLDPPNYTADDDHMVSIAYDVYNYSCDTDITAVVALTGTVTGTTAATTNDPCDDSCVIPAGGLLLAAPYWELLYHPTANGEKIKATVTITKPDDFSDADAANNADTSPEHINIIALDDIVTSPGSSDKGLLTAAPAPFSFGAVDIELASRPHRVQPAL